MVIPQVQIPNVPIFLEIRREIPVQGILLQRIYNYFISTIDPMEAGCREKNKSCEHYNLKCD